uniref:NADH-ubiquinone oxidoreductase chain 6 n=1 Tax=Omorgus chinensis TaxID=2841931 RepID=A0A8F0F2Z4_9SCAR|nr:NADH dehydrogenase subunit 6 [Omorgus chinensis]UFR81811.1 NADH dehydrogenase subunit 6 [Trogidae sp.]
MLFMLSSMTFIMSMMFMFLSHPLTMGLTLLMQTITVSLLVGFLNYNFWFSYILFLIMIGGMLVLFIYMTSVASNEKFKYSSKLLISLMIFIISLGMIYAMMDYMYVNINNFMIENLPENTMFSLSLHKFMNYPGNIIAFMLIIYLFITLVAIVKITNLKYGPLRSSN